MAKYILKRLGMAVLTILVIIIILFCLLASFLLEITPRIFSGSIAENMVEVLGVAAAVCAVLGYVLYLSFLSKANRMLKQ